MTTPTQWFAEGRNGSVDLGRFQTLDRCPLALTVTCHLGSQGKGAWVCLREGKGGRAGEMGLHCGFSREPREQEVEASGHVDRRTRREGIKHRHEPTACLGLGRKNQI